MVADQADIHHAREGPDVVRAGEGDSVANVVVSEQVRLVYGQAGVGSVVAALLAAMTVYATRGLVPVLVVAAWCVAFAALSLGRWWLLRAYAREGERRGDVFQWRRRWILSMFFAGVIWGAAGVIFPQASAPGITVFIAFVLGGLAAGAIATQSGVLPAFVAFAVPSLLPISIWFFVQGGELYGWMGSMCVLYLATLLFAARFFTNNVYRSLALGVENRGLVQELRQANEIAENSNRALKGEIVEREQTGEALRHSEEHFRNLVQGSLQGMALIRDWKVVFANSAYANILGFADTHEVTGLHVVEDLTPEESREEVYRFVRDGYRGLDEPTVFQGRARTQDGDEILVEYTMRQVNWYGQRATQLTVVDITEYARAEERLRASEERFKDFAETAADWFYETDASLRYTFVSERFQQISGWRPEEILGLTQRDLLRDSIEDPDKLERHYIELEERRPYQVDLLSAGKDGSLHVFHYAGKPIFNARGQFLGYRGAGRDVTQAYQLSKQLSYQATHDALTGLLNRRAFEQRLERVLATSRESGSTHAVCYLDLDQFKVINDTCGHMAGDELLRQLGRMLPRYIRKRDTLARLGGDEFGVLMEHCSLEQAERVARSLCRAVEEYQYVWEDRTFRIGCSIGVVPISEASASAQMVMSSADTACYAAKDKGRRRVHVYHPGDEELAQRYGEMQWAVRINRALEEDRFCLVYQPIAPVHLPTTDRQLNLLSLEPPPADEGLHFELLIRLEEPDGTLTPPGAFLPAAERYSLSAHIDRWVCDTAFDWLSQHPALMERVNLCAINLSGHSLGDAGLLEHLAWRFDRGDVQPGRICFEITETAAIANLGAATHFIQTLGERGCLFALDDFGSGLSSFAYLKTLPVQFLKIDGVFVKDIANDPIDLAMVKSINEIGQVMGKQTVAEFVESEEILTELRAIGVNYAQGFGISPPRPLSDLLEKIATPT